MSEIPLLVVGNHRYSSWSLRPWLLLQHFGVAFETLRLPLRSEQYQQQISRYSPNRRVPALRDGSVSVWDSLAICEYINERYLGGRGWPAEMHLRAQARALAAEMHSGFHDLRLYLPMNLSRPLGPPRELGGTVLADIERILAAWTECLDVNGPFLYGEFGIVDAMYAPVASRLRTYAIDLPEAPKEYVERIHALPAMQQWRQLAVAETEVIASYEQA